MNKFTIFAAAIALFSFTGNKCSRKPANQKDFNIIGNGREVKSSAERSTRTVSVKEKYSAIKVSQGITVNLTNGEGPLTASISGPTNVVDLTAIEVDNNTLIVKFKENISLKGENVIVDIKGMIPEQLSWKCRRHTQRKFICKKRWRSIGKCQFRSHSESKQNRIGFRH